MNSNVKKITSLCLLTIVIVIGLYFVFLSQKNQDKTNQNSNADLNKSVISGQGIFVASPNQHFLARAIGKALTITSLVNKTEVVFSQTFVFTPRNILWSDKSDRLYFLTDNGQTDTIFYMINVTDPLPFTVTEIVFADPEQVLRGQVELVGETDGILLLLNNSSLYSLDVHKGMSGQPKLEKDNI